MSERQGADKPSLCRPIGVRALRALLSVHQGGGTRMFRSIPKRKALVVGLIATLALAGAAFAYWTTTGSGSGSGSAASNNGTLVLHGTINSQLTPGCSSSVSFTADNANSS